MKSCRCPDVQLFIVCTYLEFCSRALVCMARMGKGKVSRWESEGKVNVWVVPWLST